MCCSQKSHGSGGDLGVVTGSIYLRKKRWSFQILLVQILKVCKSLITDYVWDVQCASHVRSNSGSAVSVCIWTNYWWVSLGVILSTCPSLVYVCACTQMSWLCITDIRCVLRKVDSCMETECTGMDLKSFCFKRSSQFNYMSRWKMIQLDTAVNYTA